MKRDKNPVNFIPAVTHNKGTKTLIIQFQQLVNLSFHLYPIVEWQAQYIFSGGAHV